MSDETTPEAEDNRPPIVKFFEKIGLVRGAVFKTVVHANSAFYIGPVTVDAISGLQVSDDRVDEVVITFSEAGTGIVHLVRWGAIARLTRET